MLARRNSYVWLWERTLVEEAVYFGHVLDFGSQNIIESQSAYNIVVHKSELKNDAFNSSGRETYITYLHT